MQMLYPAEQEHSHMVESSSSSWQLFAIETSL
jgi:hypothetical protein